MGPHKLRSRAETSRKNKNFLRKYTIFLARRTRNLVCLAVAASSNRTNVWKTSRVRYNKKELATPLATSNSYGKYYIDSARRVAFLHALRGKYRPLLQAGTLKSFKYGVFRFDTENSTCAVIKVRARIYVTHIVNWFQMLLRAETYANLERKLKLFPWIVTSFHLLLCETCISFSRIRFKRYYRYPRSVLARTKQRSANSNS